MVPVARFMSVDGRHAVVKVAQVKTRRVSALLPIPSPVFLALSALFPATWN